MRILQVVHGYPPQKWAGTELVTATLAQALAKRGHRVTVLARTVDTTAEEFSVRPDDPDHSTPDQNALADPHRVRVVHIVNNLSHPSHFRLEYDNPFFNEACHQVLTDTQPDIVHIQHIEHLSGSMIHVPAQLGYPVVLSLHDFFFACYRINLIDNHTRLCPGPDRGERCIACLESVTSAGEVRHRFRYFEKLLRIPQRVIVPSQSLADRMQQIFPFLESRLQVLAPGIVPVRPLHREDREAGTLRVLYIGALLPHKGAHVLVEATRGLPVGSIEVSLYGSRVAAWQAYTDQLEADAADLPVHFCGTYTPAQLSAILAQHDVLVVPSIWEETFSLVTREALQAGLPVIAARRGALPEVIQEGVNGLLFEPENADDLRRCLERLRTDTQLREQLTPASTPIRDPEVYAQDMEAVYEAVRGDKSTEESPRPGPLSVSAGGPKPTPTRAVSVCLPTYNGADYIEEALRSILNQTYQDFELLVVDDGSTDATLDIIQSFSDPRIQVHRNPERLGIPANWNRCLELANGELVCIFHQDDVMQPDNLERKVGLLGVHPTVGFVHSAVDPLVDASAPSSLVNWFETTTEDRVWDGLEYFRILLLNGNRVCAPTVLARRHVLHEQGGFDQDLGFACDYAMWLKLCVTYQVGFLARPLVGYRWHSDNASHAYQFERGENEIIEAGRRALQLYQDRGPHADGPVLEEAFDALTKLRRWNAALQRGKVWQEAQQANWRGVAEVQTTLIQELKGWIQELETGKTWLEEQQNAQQTWIGELEQGKTWLEEQQNAQQTWISELEQGKTWLEAQQANWRGVAEVQTTLIQELKGWIQELETGNTWLEEQGATQQAWIGELEQGKAWLEEQRQNWRELAQEHERVLQEQQVWIGELEQGKAWLEEQRSNWENIARQRGEQAAHWQAQTRHWQESFWGRMCIRLKLVEPVQEFSAKIESDTVKCDD